MRIVIDATSGVLAPDISASFVNNEADEGDAITDKLKRADMSPMSDDVENDEEDVFQDSAEGVGDAGGFTDLWIVSKARHGSESSLTTNRTAIFKTKAINPLKKKSANPTFASSGPDKLVASNIK